MGLNPSQVLYRDEFVASFEQRQSYLRDTVTTESMTKGASAIFLVTGQAEAMKERGVDGLIPASNETDAQVTVNLKEMHHRATATNYDIFQGQSDRRRIMQMRGMVAANKEIDDSIIAGLVGATTTFATTINNTNTLTIGRLVDMLSELYEQQVDNDGMITCVWTPKMHARLMIIAQVSSVDYVDKKPLIDGPQPFKFLGATHIMHPRLPGVGTATATNFIYHKAAIGHAVDTAGIKTDIGYNGEHDYSYARHTLYHGSKVLQNAGVLKVTHKDDDLLA
jgi:hypothetical protein